MLFDLHSVGFLVTHDLDLILVQEPIGAVQSLLFFVVETDCLSHEARGEDGPADAVETEKHKGPPRIHLYYHYWCYYCE